MLGARMAWPASLGCGYAEFTWGDAHADGNATETGLVPNRAGKHRRAWRLLPGRLLDAGHENQ